MAGTRKAEAETIVDLDHLAELAGCDQFLRLLYRLMKAMAEGELERRAVRAASLDKRFGLGERARRGLLAQDGDPA